MEQKEQARPIMQYVAELEDRIRGYQEVHDSLERYKWFDRVTGFTMGAMTSLIWEIVKVYVQG